MTALLINALVAIVRHLTGADIWSAVMTSVTAQDEHDKPGDEKRAAVIESVRAISLSAAGWALNLAIETAVTKLRLQQGKA